MVAYFLKALVELVTVVDPVGLVPVVLGLTVGFAPETRRLIVVRAVVIAAAIVAFFGIFGQAIFNSLGVTPEAFSIAGGALLFLVAIDMLFGRQSGTRETRREARELREREREREDLNVAVFPLAIPMIAGPGTITTIILLVNDAGPDPANYVALAVAAALTLLAAGAAMLVSLPIQKAVGTTGILVVGRVLGMLLAAVALQFILNGISTFIQHDFR